MCRAIRLDSINKHQEVLYLWGLPETMAKWSFGENKKVSQFTPTERISFSHVHAYTIFDTHTLSMKYILSLIHTCNIFHATDTHRISISHVQTYENYLWCTDIYYFDVHTHTNLAGRHKCRAFSGKRTLLSRNVQCD